MNFQSGCETSGERWARIVVVAYRSKDHLQACLDAVAAQTFSDFEVIVVDNDCPDNSTGSLVLPDQRFHILRAGYNAGFAGGTNLGAAGSTAPWIITLNPDTLPAPDWLAELYKAAERQPEAAVLSSTLVSMKNAAVSDGFGDVMSIYGIAWRGGTGRPVQELPQQDAFVFGACAAAAAYRHDVFEAMAGFDEGFFCYLEDVDLAFRIQNAGLDCLQVRNALVAHAGSASSAGQREFPVYQSYKNGLRVIVRNAPALVLPIMLPGYLTAQVYIILRNLGKPETKARLSGLKAAIPALGDAWRTRKQSRARATISSWALMKRLAWSPLSLRNLRAKTVSPFMRNEEGHP